jgi:hypothetical protein
MNRFTVLACLALPLLWSCDSETATVSGTNDETTTSLGVIRKPDGKPAAGARVILYASGDTQTTPRALGIVDNDGHVVLTGTPQPGLYNLLVRSTENNEALFQDSLVSNGTQLTVFNDTLRRTGKLIGRVRVEPQDKPTIAWVQLIGAGRYVNLDDSGRFAIDSLPAGRYTLAAQTLTPKYTPTFRYPAVRSDSTTDLGIVDLVYTGVPMVRNVKAAWDSLASTVTVRWDSSSEPGLLGYRVLRSRYNDPQLMDTMAYVTGSQNWTDTLFRGFRVGGSLGGQYDVFQTDLFYRVVAVTNNGMSPISFADSLNVRSPDLTNVWAPKWNTTGTLPAQYTTNSLDSLGNGLALLTTQDSFQTLWTSPDGKAWNQGLTLPANANGIFWKGKLWWTSGHQTGQSYDANVLAHETGIFPAIGRIIDTIHVHSFDNDSVSTKSIPVRGDTITAAVIIPMGEQLVLAEERLIICGGSSVPYLTTMDMHTYTDGKDWMSSNNRDLVWWYTWNQYDIAIGSFSARYQIFPIADRYLFAKTSWLRKDTATAWESADGKPPQLWPTSIPESYGLPYFDKAIQMEKSALFTSQKWLCWAPQNNLKEWHEITAPSRNINTGLAWRGQLLVSDGTTLWMAPIPSGF